MKALLAAKEAVLNLHYTDTRHKKTMTNMQEERQNTLLLYREVFIHVITEMTKYHHGVCIFISSLIVS